MKYLQIYENFDPSLRDNPREAVKKIPGYTKIVSAVAANRKNPTAIKSLIEDWVLENEAVLAQLIFCSKKEDTIYCEHGAEIAGQILSDAKISHWLEVGDIKGRQSHAWARIDNTIIDPTKDQFTGIQLQDYVAAVNGENGWKKEYRF